MVSEIRHVLFRPVEVIEAYKEYACRLGTYVPKGPVVSAGPECEGSGKPVFFRIVIGPEMPIEKGFVTADNSLNREIMIDTTALTAALILYCRDRRIPLPVVADKSLQRFCDQTCLLATINPKHDKATALLRM